MDLGDDRLPVVEDFHQIFVMGLDPGAGIPHADLRPAVFRAGRHGALLAPGLADGAAQVVARREATAGALEDDHRDIPVFFSRPQGMADFFRHGPVDGVLLVRAVERDARQLVFHLVDDVLVSHLQIPRCVPDTGP